MAAGGELTDRRGALGALAALGGAAALYGSGVRVPARAALDPRDFGARGNGDGDDTPAIQRAIDRVWQAGGGEVRLAATDAFYAIRSPIVCRPGVSLVGDGNMPRLTCADPAVAMFLAGNFHPDFISRARYDAVAPVRAGDRQVRLTDGRAAGRYRAGDQVYVTSTAWGTTGGFGVPHHGWLNVVRGVHGDVLLLREPIDVAVDAKITLLRDTPARGGMPLFFHADAAIAGLDLEAAGHLMSDSAMLRVAVTGNRVHAATAIYGNSFQHVRWTGNHFRFTRHIGEQSLCSLSTLTQGNRFTYDAAGNRGEAGFYFQEYGRDLRVIDNDVDVGDFPSAQFLVSIAAAQRVVVERLRVRGQSMPALIYMGAAGSADFPITGNYVRQCRFDVARSVRFAMVQGKESPFMHGNGIVDCVFTGMPRVGDAFRIESGRGDFRFTGNRWGNGACLTMGGTTGLTAADNAVGPRRGALCRAIS